MRWTQGEHGEYSKLLSNFLTKQEIEIKVFSTQRHKMTSKLGFPKKIIFPENKKITQWVSWRIVCEKSNNYIPSISPSTKKNSNEAKAFSIKN